MPKHLTKSIKDEVSSDSASDTENITQEESSDEEIELDSDESKLKMLKNQFN